MGCEFFYCCQEMKKLLNRTETNADLEWKCIALLVDYETVAWYSHQWLHGHSHSFLITVDMSDLIRKISPTNLDIF